ncbi:MAG: inorganic phosphate transporter [Egibacteraceae bacterium]
MESDPLLLGAALGFAVVNGMNDGGALVGAGLKVGGLPPAVAAGMLALALVVAPLVVGTQVAATLVHRLVSFSDVGGLVAGRTALLVAVGTAVVVVAVLSRRGLPTSLTLALVGAITGAGIGGGLSVSLPTLGLVLGAGLAAPVVGALGGFALSRAGGLLPVTGRLSRRIRYAHVGAFSMQCLAYAGNDGQKMVAVLVVATGATDGIDVSVPELLALAALFTGGLVAGLRPAAGMLSAEIIPVRPPDAVAAEISSAGAVLASAALGAPVSMTQSVAAALVGAGMSHGPRRVRWRAAGRLGLAWLFTLPVSALLAGVLTRGGALLS